MPENNITELNIIRDENPIHVYFALQKETGALFVQTATANYGPMPDLNNNTELRVYIDTYTPKQADRFKAIFPVINMIIQSALQKRAGETMGMELCQLSADNYQHALDTLKKLGEYR